MAIFSFFKPQTLFLGNTQFWPIIIILVLIQTAIIVALVAAVWMYRTRYVKRAKVPNSISQGPNVINAYESTLPMPINAVNLRHSESLRTPTRPMIMKTASAGKKELLAMEKAWDPDMNFSTPCKKLKASKKFKKSKKLGTSKKLRRHKKIETFIGFFTLTASSYFRRYPLPIGGHFNPNLCPSSLSNLSDAFNVDVHVHAHVADPAVYADKYALGVQERREFPTRVLLG